MSGKGRSDVSSAVPDRGLLVAAFAAVVLEVLLFTWARNLGWSLEWAAPAAFAGAAMAFFGIRATGPVSRTGPTC